MTALKNRGFQLPSRAILLSFALGLAIFSSHTSCREQEGSGAPLMVASSLSFAVERWAQAQTRPPRWQAAGSQRVRQWLEGGARPSLSILASPRVVEALREGRLISWELALGCTELALAERGSAEPHVSAARGARLSAEAWRAWGEGLSPERRLASAAAEVPLGQYTRSLLKRSAQRFGAAWRERVEAQVITETLSAGSAATLLELEEVDAAILYQSMAYGRPELRFSPLPQPLSPRPRYIAVGQDQAGEERALALRAWLWARPEYGVQPCVSLGGRAEKN